MVTYVGSSQQDQSTFQQTILTGLSGLERERDRDRWRGRKERKKRKGEGLKGEGLGEGLKGEGLSYQHEGGVRSGYHHNIVYICRRVNKEKF